MIIDKKEKEFEDVPETLEGEVLLKRDVDKDGNIKGYLTAPVGIVKNMQGKSDEQLSETGWLEHKDIIAGIDIASFNYQEKIKNE
jgi:hypothetical protein